jgi:hypothetical protein
VLAGTAVAIVAARLRLCNGGDSGS